jgi:hypothetical protein
MKYKWMLSVVLSVVMFSANAQFRKIPPEVTDSFKARFDKATQVSWTDNLINFQATFKLGNDNVRAFYNSKGELLRSEKNVTFEELPLNVKDGFKKSKYADWTVKDIRYIEDKDKQVQYRLQVVKNSDIIRKNLLFSTTGQLVDDTITL